MGTCPQLSSLMFQEFCLSAREEKRISRGLRRRQELAGAEGPGASSASSRSICVAGSNQRPGLASGTRLPEGLAEGSLVACRLP